MLLPRIAICEMRTGCFPANESAESHGLLKPAVAFGNAARCEPGGIGTARHAHSQSSAVAAGCTQSKASGCRRHSTTKKPACQILRNRIASSPDMNPPKPHARQYTAAAFRLTWARTLCICLCMPSKTISVDLDAYELLRRARRQPGESFSRVIKRASWAPPAATGAALLERLEGSCLLSDETLDRLEEAQLQDLPPQRP